MLSILVVFVTSTLAVDTCILTDRSKGKSYNFTGGAKLAETQGYTYKSESYGFEAYLSFCTPIDGAKIGCKAALPKNTLGVYKYDDGRCVSLGNTQAVTAGDDPYVTYSGGGKCDLGRTSSASVSFTCDKSAGVGEMTYFRFNEFCILNAFATSDMTC
ncbi:hypothetical protein BLNAU_12652 [Blattamonas nauphoetae]|uniref:Uncharacterized protein n=1 Tax=Blattamonas nauphoetae TaxID=2049346 RepID=A0ABQ9XQJ5_9EUKA|nr:hypothetical protein BLNAU_12652 [Blattamonas nauphoetae]